MNINEIIKKYYKVDNGNMIFLSRGFISEINSKDKDWYIENLSTLSEEQRLAGYESLKANIARIVFEIQNKSQNYRKIDSVILKKETMAEFMVVAEHFFGKRNPKLANHLVWYIEMNEPLSFWIKFHFLLGAYEDEITKKNYKIVYEIYQKSNYRPLN